MMKKSISLLLTAAIVAVSACCASQEGSRRAGQAAPAQSTPEIKAKTTPVEAVPEQSRGAGSGNFNQYKFTYRRAGGETEAVFAPAALPWNDAFVVEAAREVLVAAYDDRSENFPRRALWQYRGQEVNAIKLEGERFEYVFLPLKEEGRDGAKQVRTIVFWQLSKGTVK